jgi:predicted protein tyrosine phosphatase
MRSLTAEHLFHQSLDYVAKSAGTSPQARVRVDEDLVAWADVVFVMEEKHEALLRENFGAALAKKKVICLHIPDIYQCDEQGLLDVLKGRLADLLQVPE